MRRVLQRMEPGQRERLEQAVIRLDALATLMDAAFLIPGTNTRMDLAGIVGLIVVNGPRSLFPAVGSLCLERRHGLPEQGRTFLKPTA